MVGCAAAVLSLEAELANLLKSEAEHDAALRAASALTKAEPNSEIRARHHAECAQRLAHVARQREAAEERLLTARQVQTS